MKAGVRIPIKGIDGSVLPATGPAATAAACAAAFAVSFFAAGTTANIIMTTRF